MKSSSSVPSSAAFLLLGLAAGTAITWALNNGAKEKLLSGNFQDIVPKDLINSATRALQEGIDRVVAAIDDGTESRRF